MKIFAIAHYCNGEQLPDKGLMFQQQQAIEVLEDIKKQRADNGYRIENGVNSFFAYYGCESREYSIEEREVE